MTPPARTRRRLAVLMLNHAARRLGRGRSEWAAAMASEAAALARDDDALGWSAGCVLASYVAPGAWDWARYPAALTAGILLMAAYQWSADESLITLAVLSLIGVVLGLLKPQRSWISGAAIGLVVAAVNSFETLTGVRPAYETMGHSLLDDAQWIVFIPPALAAAWLGGYAGRKFRANSGATS